jgi:hypothetical protein
MQLVMRTPGTHDESPAGAAAQCRSSLVSGGVTHFVESDPMQALLIAQQAPLLRVIWWDALTQTGMLVGAHAWT